RDVRLNDFGQSFGELRPRRAAVGRLEDAVACATEALPLDEALLLLPERGVDDARVRRVDADVVAARVLVLVEHLLERPPAVGRPEDAALRVRPVRVA